MRETFTVAANLRLPRRMDKAEKAAIVEAIITELGLAKAANTRIGALHCDSSSQRFCE